jgi:hypothetical protein
MKIYDKSGIELTSPDMEKGYLVPDSLLIMHHEAVEAVAEKGHWETVKEYPNGGKDVEWVVDVPGVEAKEAYDEQENILRYVEYTAKEIATRRIDELKAKLQDTDYMILKVVEGAATLAEIAETVKKRAAWRKEINELEEVK